KIQAVHIEQNWLHKILNLAQVSFDSPGSADAEVKINLGKAQAESLKAFITGSHLLKQPDNSISERETIAKLSFGDLVRLGISANHLETLAIVLGLGISFFNNIKEILEDQYRDAFSLTTSDLLNSDIFFIMYVVVGVLVFSIIASFIRIVFKYANFSVNRTEKGFSIHGGLINTTEKTIPFKKIQFLSWKTSWIRKKLPIYLLEYHSIGSPQSNQKLKVKIPVTSETLLNRLVDIYHRVGNDDLPITRISKKYIFRTTLIRGILPFILLAGTSYFFIGSKALSFIVIPVYVFISCWLYRQKFQLRLDGEILHIKGGIFGHSETMLKWNNIQSVMVMQSFYQRRHKLASLRIFTAGGALTIPFITQDRAQALQNFALYKLESSPSTWM
ncbi:MAG TPA: PH domain-containing protein, partial [Daejeonella sp.]|nr:PH domain-containing protein [Daejeonella sp.]